LCADLVKISHTLQQRYVLPVPIWHPFQSWPVGPQITE
jgi:hypothetical protein